MLVVGLLLLLPSLHPVTAVRMRTTPPLAAKDDQHEAPGGEGRGPSGEGKASLAVAGVKRSREEEDHSRKAKENGDAKGGHPVGETTAEFILGVGEAKKNSADGANKITEETPLPSVPGDGGRTFAQTWRADRSSLAGFWRSIAAKTAGVEFASAPPDAGQAASSVETQRAMRRLERKRREKERAEGGGEPDRSAQMEIFLILAAAGLGALVGFMCFSPPAPPRRRAEQDPLY